MTNEELQSKTINYLRFPLIVAVVLAHVVTNDRGQLMNYVAQMDYTALSGMDIYNLIRVLFAGFIPAAITVPCFFIFSGFLFFYKGKIWNRTVYFGKLKSRTMTLLVPYLLWCIIALLFAALLAIVGIEGSIPTLIDELREKGFLSIFWNYYHDTGAHPYNGTGVYPYNIPMWYMKDLILAALCSPLVYYFVKYTKLAGVAALGIAYVVLTGMNISFPIILFFFTFGAWLAIHGKNMVVVLRKGKWLWGVLTFITLILCLCRLDTNLYGYLLALFIISGCFTVLNFTSWLVERGCAATPLYLAQTGFLIYGMHGFVLGRCKQVLNALFDSTSSPVLILKFFLAPILCIGICVGLYWIAQKTVPKLLNILTGSR